MQVLIPIAKSNRTGETVFIEEVSSGLDCDCCCIGCGVPLVAKKGEVKIHHFSHAPKQISTGSLCPFSFERSVFLMVRLLLSEAKTISLPAYNFCLQDNRIKKPYPCHVTHKSELTIDRVEFLVSSDKNHKEHHTDYAVVYRSGYPLALSFHLNKQKVNFYQNKNTRPKPFKYQDKNIAHLSIDLSELQALFRKKKCDYRLLLNKFLFESRLNKHWIYHPNEMPYRNAFQQQLDNLQNESIKLKKQQNIQPENHREKLPVQKKVAPISDIAQTPPITAKASPSITTPLIKRTPTIVHHVEQAKSLTEMKCQSKKRLAQLLQQVTEFKLKGHTHGHRCSECYFMNLNQSQCQFCQSINLQEVFLDDDYFDNIDHKYDCACFSIKSVKKLAEVEIKLPDELIG